METPTESFQMRSQEQPVSLETPKRKTDSMQHPDFPSKRRWRSVNPNRGGTLTQTSSQPKSILPNSSTVAAHRSGRPTQPDKTPWDNSSWDGSTEPDTDAER
ncbi:hypothetical protein Pla52o_48250 [Novipirellula galeiformis]|uniref:Uncharacterized protein n=1 Tax=Novipirellula galeiformis TaxID=2528004 RepID=A0A5C6CAA3_9BACT|nr:hypothetical protein [Novipirellula galeiformis]TWU20306.1 hypothetical protein Pla52o_48250 [Novipirellula galeiformis]